MKLTNQMIVELNRKIKNAFDYTTDHEFSKTDSLAYISHSEEKGVFLVIVNYSRRNTDTTALINKATGWKWEKTEVMLWSLSEGAIEYYGAHEEDEHMKAYYVYDTELKQFDFAGVYDQYGPYKGVEPWDDHGGDYPHEFVGKPDLYHYESPDNPHIKMANMHGFKNLEFPGHNVNRLRMAINRVDGVNDCYVSFAHEGDYKIGVFVLHEGQLYPPPNDDIYTAHVPAGIEVVKFSSFNLDDFVAQLDHYRKTGKGA